MTFEKISSASVDGPRGFRATWQCRNQLFEQFKYIASSKSCRAAAAHRRRRRWVHSQRNSASSCSGYYQVEFLHSQLASQFTWTKNIELTFGDAQRICKSCCGGCYRVAILKSQLPTQCAWPKNQNQITRPKNASFYVVNLLNCKNASFQIFNLLDQNRIQRIIQYCHAEFARQQWLMRWILELAADIIM